MSPTKIFPLIFSSLRFFVSSPWSLQGRFKTYQVFCHPLSSQMSPPATHLFAIRALTVVKYINAPCTLCCFMILLINIRKIVSGSGGRGHGNSILSVQFYCKSKTVLKSKVYSQKLDHFSNVLFPTPSLFIHSFFQTWPMPLQHWDLYCSAIRSVSSGPQAPTACSSLG